MTVRIRGSEYYRNPAATMEKVSDELAKKGINVDYEHEGLESNEVDEKEQTIISGIKNRAAEIRREWNRDDYLEDSDTEILVVEDVEELNDKTQIKTPDESQAESLGMASAEKEDLGQILLTGFEVEDRQLTIDTIDKAKNKENKLQSKDKMKPRFDFRKR